MTIQSRTRLLARAALVALLVVNVGIVGNVEAGDLVGNIRKAPIVADGDIRGRQTDFVIDLNLSLDPADPGIAIAATDEVRVTLPDGFVFDQEALEEFPVCSIGMGLSCPSALVADACVPGTLACTTAVFLQGYPQSPVIPDISRDDNTLVLTPRSDTGPVVKQIHIIGKAIVNPRPGRYRIDVEHVNAAGEVIAQGSGTLRVLPKVRRSINVTSVFASLVGGGPPFANTIYQTTLAGQTEFPWNFLFWDRRGEPFTDIELRPVTEDHYLLRRDGRTVGHVSIDAPEDASGYFVDLIQAETLPGTPVIGLSPGGGPPPPVERYEIQFDVGLDPVPGRYTTTFRLNNGNEVQMFVDVPG